MNKRIVRTVLILTVAVLSYHFTAEIKPTIYLIGDSTMADKPLDDNPERGWGQLIPNFFSDDVIIENHARNGRSTKSFIDQGLWKTIFEKIKPGDYVFIQFGHNDSKISDTTRYAAPRTTYRENLIRYVNDSRSKGAVPVLLTPVNRSKFDSEGKFVDQHGEYPGVVREIAAELNVPLIDLHAKSLKYFTDLGPNGTKELFLLSVPKKTYKALPDGKVDNTHFTRAGAIKIAGMVAEGIQELHLPIEKFLISNPLFSDLGNGKVVALDYFFNHEIKKDAEGKEYQFHYTWEDKENSGFFRLGNIIENLGASLYEIKTAPGIDDLKNVSIYIIVDPDTPAETAQPNYISDSSAAVIAGWVKSGGVLVLMGNDKGNSEFNNLNRLSEKFGIIFNEVSLNQVVGKNWDMGKFDLLPDHPIFEGIRKIYMKEISTFSLKEPAAALLTRGEEIIIACSEYGKGFVFAVGDPWIYNEYIDHRRLTGDFQNYETAENIFKWLLSKAKVVKKSGQME